MTKYRMPKIFNMEDLPEYQRLLSVNPGSNINPNQVAVMYSKAIDWYAILETIWPDFSTIKYQSIEVAYLFIHDPDDNFLPVEAYRQIAEMISVFWKIQLEDLYPQGGWKVNVREDPEITVEVEVKN